MIIDQINIRPYQLSFKKEYINAKFKINHREGWIIELHSSGVIGFGDACPLEGFNEESYSQAGYGLEGFKFSLSGDDEVEVKELLSLSQAHGESQPSVEFAIESAVCDLASKLDGLPLYKYLNRDASESVRVSYYPDSPEKPFDGMVIKLKIDTRNVFKQIDRIQSIIDQYHGMIKLRLDFNESYDLPRAIRICKMLEGMPIDYIEQPLPKESFEDMYELTLHTEIPIAVDEMITDFDSVEKVLESQCADVFILKPMVIGGISKTKKIVDIVTSEGKRANISSLIESNVGRLTYLHMSAAFEINEECGIATNTFFKSDISDFPASVKGKVNIYNKPGIALDKINL